METCISRRVYLFCYILFLFLQRTLEICKTKFIAKDEDTSLATPMEFVGVFLQSVYDELCVHIPQKEVVSSKSPVVLHYTPGYSQDQLMKLLLELYHDNLPESYEFLKCFPSCTENELCLFFDRVNGVSSIYTVIGVNDLPFTLQEVHMSFLVCTNMPVLGVHMKILCCYVVFRAVCLIVFAQINYKLN